MENQFACKDLLDKNISGWIVLEAVTIPDRMKEGWLSYVVERDGTKGFMKVLDFDYCHNKQLVTGEKRSEFIERMTSAFNYEAKIAELCAGCHMSNVIHYLDSGEIEIPGYLIGTVSFIVFESSQGDVRSFLDFSPKVDMASKLKVLIDKLVSLHQVACGIKQLHSQSIAYHNLTPDSIEVFDDMKLYKLSGLNHTRSQIPSVPAPESYTLFNGDWTFAPPEAFFSYRLPNHSESYYQVDTFMLGNLMVYYLTSFNLTALINYYLLPNNLKDWASQGASYEQVLPDIINAYQKSLDAIRYEICSESIRESLIQLIGYLCYPDPAKRGHPGNFKESLSNADLQRVITRLNVIYSDACLELSSYNGK